VPTTKLAGGNAHAQVPTVRDGAADVSLRLLGHATEAHARGLSVGLKNALDLVTALVSAFDWALDEECLQYSECAALAPFVAAGKAVLHCEYATSKTGICDKDPKGFSTIIKDLNLDAFRLTCP
jgi:hypothetical protein